MSSLFDRLQNELDDRGDEGGISILDLIDLPENLRRLMRFMLRAVVVSMADVSDEVAGWKEKDRMPPDELLTALMALVKQGWLIQLGEKDKPNFRVNLRRRKASTLDDSIWGALDSKIMERIEAQAKSSDGMDLSKRILGKGEEMKKKKDEKSEDEES